VVVPLVTPGLVSSSILAFMASFDDVIIALFLSGTRTLTLPRKLWTEVGQSEPSPVVAAVSTLLIVVSVVTVIGLDLLRRRSRGAFEVIPGARERPQPVSTGA
jgi:ABC-type spermidine/putrescine transport system permease subunit II